MATHLYNTTLRFRADVNLAARAEEKARREGMTVSELLRHALRRELREAA